MTISSFDPAAGRRIKAPFRIQAANGATRMEVVCNRVLRFLPGKRMVCSGSSNERAVVVKLFLDHRRAGKHCRREKRGSLALREAGIAAPELLFHGHLVSGENPLLVFEQIHPAVDFSTAWSNALTRRQRAQLWEHMVSLIARQHKAGLCHKDMHPGNFLLSGRILYTIDGAAVSLRGRGRALARGRSLANLALFFAQFSPQFDFLIPDAFRVYLQKRQWPQTSAAYERLTRKIRLQRRLREKTYLKKIRRESSAYICQKTWQRFLVCDRKTHTPNVARFLSDPDAFFDSETLLKNGNSSTVALVEVDARLLVVKRYNIKNTRHALGRAPRPSRAWNCWKNAHRLALLGIATPAPVAMIEERFGPLRKRAYYITEFVHGTNVGDMFRTEKAASANPAHLAAQFAEILQILANAFIVHGDVKASNFLLADGRLVVLDLDAMDVYPWPVVFRKKFRKDCRRLLKNWQDMPEIRKIFSRQIQKIRI